MNIHTTRMRSANAAALRAKVLLLFAIVFAFYYFTRSPALDEWDSVQGVLVIQRGLLDLPKAWRPLFFLPPFFLLSISISLAIENHREELPPLKLVRYLQRQYSSAERLEVIPPVRRYQSAALEG